MKWWLSMSESGNVSDAYVADYSDRDPCVPSDMRDSVTGQSLWRGWLALVRISIRRQARMRSMVWIAAALLGLSALFVAVISVSGGWKLTDRRPPTMRRYTYRQWLERAELQRAAHLRSEAALALDDAVIASIGAALEHSAFLVFSRWVIFAIFQSFLLPLCTLSFATNALGSERESRTLIWIVTRPVPRPAIYLAKYVAALPWCLGFNLLGFAGICLAAGEPGQLALRLYWPAVICGTFALAAFFHLLAALFRRPAIVGLIYAFFFETLVADLPGDLKRCSMSFYIRSMMFDGTNELGLAADQLSVYNPVSGWTALAVLIGATLLFTLIGMFAFARRQHSEDI